MVRRASGRLTAVIALLGFMTLISGQYLEVCASYCCAQGHEIGTDVIGEAKPSGCCEGSESFAAHWDPAPCECCLDPEKLDLDNVVEESLLTRVQRVENLKALFLPALTARAVPLFEVKTAAGRPHKLFTPTTAQVFKLHSSYLC